MKKSFIPVCAGAPLLALGFGAAPIAWAAPGPGPDGASVSVNGELKHFGAAEAESTASTGRAPNVAVAVKGSFAQAADGSGNHAVAVNFSNAEAELGSGNHAVAVNVGTNGDSPVNGISNARANTGDKNMALATCGGTTTATGGGDREKSHGSCGG